jgi:tRNA G18 (ribose-2'-O)-methylase SpoU
MDKQSRLKELLARERERDEQMLRESDELVERALRLRESVESLFAL